MESSALENIWMRLYPSIGDYVNNRKNGGVQIPAADVLMEQYVLLIGPRATGKTAILNRMYESVGNRSDSFFYDKFDFSEIAGAIRQFAPSGDGWIFINHFGVERSGKLLEQLNELQQLFEMQPQLSYYIAAHAEDFFPMLDPFSLPTKLKIAELEFIQPTFEEAPGEIQQEIKQGVKEEVQQEKKAAPGENKAYAEKTKQVPADCYGIRRAVQGSDP